MSTPTSKAWRRLATVGALSLTLAACTGMTVVGGGFPYGSYSRDTVNYLAAQGPLAVRTVGTVGDMPAPATADAIVARFRLPGEFTPATFAVATPEQVARGYHLTFVINPDATPDVLTVCGPEAGAIPTHAAGAEMRIVAAYCYRDEALNRVIARAPAAAPDSAAFGALLDRVGLALFPYRDPSVNEGKRRRES